MYKNIVFDMGRVLTDYDADLATKQFTDDPDVIREVNLIVYHSGEWTMMDAGLISEGEALAAFQKRASSEYVADVIEKSFLNWDKYNLTLHPGMEDVVRDLKKAGHHLYVLSNINMRLCPVSKFRNYIPAPECFDGIFLSAPHKCMKPQPIIYRMFCEENHVDPQDSIFIDDLKRNVKAAMDYGMGGYVFDGDVEKLREMLEI